MSFFVPATDLVPNLSSPSVSIVDDNIRESRNLFGDAYWFYEANPWLLDTTFTIPANKMPSTGKYSIQIHFKAPNYGLSEIGVYVQMDGVPLGGTRQVGSPEGWIAYTGGLPPQDTFINTYNLSRIYINEPLGLLNTNSLTFTIIPDQWGDYEEIATYSYIDIAGVEFFTVWEGGLTEIHPEKRLGAEVYTQPNRYVYMASFYDPAVSNYGGYLYYMDIATGVMTRVGNIGFSVAAMTFHPETNVLYGVTSSNSLSNPLSLITINPLTGAGTVIGPLGGASSPITDLVFQRPSYGSAYQLYGWSSYTEWHFTGAGESRLVVINTTTGTKGLQGPSGLAPPGSPATFGGGVAKQPNASYAGLFLTPYGTVGNSFYQVWVNTGSAATNPVLITGTGIAWEVGSMDWSRAGGVLYVQMYAGSGGYCYFGTLNTVTGAFTFADFDPTYLGSTAVYITAMAFPPGDHII